MKATLNDFLKKWELSDLPRSSLDSRLRQSKIYLQTSNQYQGMHELRLPISLKKLNNQLPETDRVRRDETLYLPPAPVVEIMPRIDCRAASIIVEEKRNRVVISCEYEGHALGFIRFYGERFERKS